MRFLFIRFACFWRAGLYLHVALLPDFTRKCAILLCHMLLLFRACAHVRIRAYHSSYTKLEYLHLTDLLSLCLVEVSTYLPRTRLLPLRLPLLINAFFTSAHSSFHSPFTAH